MKRPEPKGFVAVRYADACKVLISIRGDESVVLRKLVAHYIELSTHEFFVDDLRLYNKVAFILPTKPVSVTATICELYNIDECGKYLNRVIDRINYATCGKESDAIDNMTALITNYQQN